MTLGGGNEYLGEGRSEFVIKQFMADLTDSERVLLIMQFNSLEERKPATDINAQMRNYYLVDPRPPSARPHRAILIDYITLVLNIDGDNYTFCETEALASGLKAQYPTMNFKIRQSTYSDEITSIAAYLENLNLQAMAIVVSDETYAWVEISDESPPF